MDFWRARAPRLPGPRPPARRAPACGASRPRPATRSSCVTPTGEERWADVTSTVVALAGPAGPAGDGLRHHRAEAGRAGHARDRAPPARRAGERAAGVACCWTARARSPSRTPTCWSCWAARRRTWSATTGSTSSCRLERPRARSRAAYRAASRPAAARPHEEQRGADALRRAAPGLLEPHVLHDLAGAVTGTASIGARRHRAAARGAAARCTTPSTTRSPACPTARCSWTAWAARWRAQQPPARPALCAVLFLDLDRFKMVNDSLGHAAGDQLLVEVGRPCCAGVVRPGDTVARLGGDEFAILLEDLERPGEADARWPSASTRRWRAPFTLGGQEVFVDRRASASPSRRRGYERAGGRCCATRDTAMYQAKAQGKARPRGLRHARCTAARCARWSSRPTCAARWSARSSCSTTSRSSSSATRPRSPASRRWCAGSTRSAAWSRRRSSSPSPRRPG